MLRVGIAGLGFMGMVHYLTYEKLRGVRVDAICETSRRRRQGDWRDIQGNFGPAGRQMDLSNVATYASIDEMLGNERLDLIDITLPPALHAEVAIKALRAGKHVFCEKPMALYSADCVRMVREAERAGKQLFIGHVLPFFPEYAWARKQIESDKYGKLLGGSFKRVISDPAWLSNYWSAEHIGGPMFDLHIHDAHFIRLLFGMPTSVRTRGRLRGRLAEHWNTQFCYDQANVTVHAASGTIGQQGRPFDHGFEIHLERATLVFEFAVIGGQGQFLCPPTVLAKSGRVHRPKLVGDDPMDAFSAELREVVQCLRRGRSSELLAPSLARDAVVLCDKQTRSLQSGRSVRI